MRSLLRRALAWLRRVFLCKSAWAHKEEALLVRRHIRAFLAARAELRMSVLAHLAASGADAFIKEVGFEAAWKAAFPDPNEIGRLMRYYKVPGDPMSLAGNVYSTLSVLGHRYPGPPRRPLSDAERRENSFVTTLIEEVGDTEVDDPVNNVINTVLDVLDDD